MARKQNRKKGIIRRFAAAALVCCMLCGTGMQANAATLKDIFDEHYYADMYPDLKEAYGYNRDKLWQHFVEFGLSEGRNMNGLIDVVKYRETYGDLDAAFGDNWNAYLNHYLIFGAKEHRDTGTDFNALDYAGRYEDLQAAYGTNVLALWEHYRTFGASENREARDESVVYAERIEAEEEDSENEEKGAGCIIGSPTGSSRRVDLPNGEWRIFEYDGNRKLLRQTDYYANGVVQYIGEYGSQGKVVKMIWYEADGSIRVITELTYSSDGIHLRQVDYNADNILVAIYENHDDGKPYKTTKYNTDGSIAAEIYYSDKEPGTKAIIYNADGTKTVREWRGLYQSGGFIRKTGYYANGNIEYVNEYDGNGDSGRMLKRTTYYESGALHQTEEYDSEGNCTKNIIYNEDGSIFSQE